MNSELGRYLEAYATSQASASATPTTAYRARRWRVKDRLSERDIAELIAAFIAGTPKHELAKRYGIHLKSVKHLLREAGGEETIGV